MRHGPNFVIVRPANPSLLIVLRRINPKKGAILSYADGHAEYRKWRDDRTLGEMTTGTASPNNPDIAWLQQRATGTQ